MNNTFDLNSSIEVKEFGFHVVECPCCHNQTLDNHFICSICGWEYDGIVEDNDYSSANDATLSEYRNRVGWN